MDIAHKIIAGLYERGYTVDNREAGYSALSELIVVYQRVHKADSEGVAKGVINLILEDAPSDESSLWPEYIASLTRELMRNEEQNAQSTPMADTRSVEGIQRLVEHLHKTNPTYYNASHCKLIQKRMEDMLERLPIGEEHAVAASELADVPASVYSDARTLGILFKHGFCHRKFIDMHKEPRQRCYVYWRTHPVITFDELRHVIICLLGDLGFQVLQDADHALGDLIKEYKRFYRTDEEGVKRGLPSLIVENMPQNQFVITSKWLTTIKEELMVNSQPPKPKAVDTCSVAGLEKLVDNIRTLKEVDVVNPEIPHAALLERLDKVEAETEAIRERYEALEKRLVENELLTALKKAELKKDEEQHKLDALEERLKRWEDENADVVKGILK